MNLVELQRKLMGAARANPPGDAVPYAFEKRITARLKEMKVVDPLQVWGRGLWRAAVFCVAVAALLTAYSMLAPSNNPEPISQQVEQTLFAATESNGSDLTGQIILVILVNSWKIILSTLLIFGAGVLTGGLLVGHVMNVRPVTAAPQNPALASVPNPNQVDARRMELLHRMQRELDLSGPQHQRIERIILQNQERTRNMWKPIAMQMGREMQEQIRSELTPEQRKKWNELNHQQRQNKRPDDLPPRRIPGTNQPPAVLPIGAPDSSNIRSTNSAPTAPQIPAPASKPE